MAFKRIYAELFRLSIPIVLFSLAVPLINVIDSSTVIGLLEGQVGTEQAKNMLGILTGRAQSLAGIPIILAIALSQSVVPVIASAYARNDLDQVRTQASKALLLSILSGVPVVIAMSVLARPINGFMFGDEEGTAIIVMLTVNAMFQIVMQTSGSILMGLGRMKALIVHVVIGIVIKLVGSFLLAPLFGIYGIISATMICFLVMTQLNLSVLKRMVDYRIMGRRWTGFIVTAAAITLIGIGLETLGHQFVQPFGFRINHGIVAVIVGSFMMVIYPVLLMLTGVIKQEDLQTMPGPVRKALGLAGRFTRKPLPR